MDYKSGFTFVFEDPNWFKKMLIAVVMLLLSVFVVPGLALAGYFVKSLRNAADGTEYPLPEWTGWGELISIGLKMLLTGLIFMIPFFIVMIFIISLAATAPIFLGDTGDIITIASIFFSALAQLAIFTFGIIAYAFTPAIFMRFAISDSISQTVNPGNILAIIKMNSTDYVVICLLGIALETMAFSGIIAFIVGILFAVIYVELVKTFLLGQYLRINSKDQNTQEQEDNAIDSCYNPSISIITD
jgi:hypothetical protein